MVLFSLFGDERYLHSREFEKVEKITVAVWTTVLFIVFGTASIVFSKYGDTKIPLHAKLLIWFPVLIGDIITFAVDWYFYNLFRKRCITAEEEPVYGSMSLTL